MKILMLSPRFPLPADDGGKIGIFELFKHFSLNNCSVTLFSYYFEDIETKYINQAEQYDKVILYKKNTKNNVSNLLKSIFYTNSLFVQKHIDHDVINLLSDYVLKENIDIIEGEHASMAYLAYLISQKTGVKFTHRVHNIEYKIWQRFADSKSNLNPIKYYLSIQANKLKKNEDFLIKNASLNMTVSPKEQKELEKEFPEANILLILSGIDFKNIQISSFESKQKNVFMHATTFNWVHNIDAISWYINKVQTIVYKSNPNAKLWIFGKNAPEEFSNYTGIGVELKGYVDSIAEYYHQSLFYIAPLFVGSGIRIKIIEAMSYGLPVIASSISAEGISELAGEDDGLFICDNEQDFANKVIELLADPKRTYQLGLNARKFAEKHFDFNKNIGLLINKYIEIINSKN